MQLIDSVKEKYDSLPQEGKNFADRFILVEAPQLLATEKEQLIRAYKMYNYSYESGEQFYNQTYGQ